MASKARRATAGLQDMPAPWFRSLIREHLNDESGVRKQELGKPRLQLFMSSMGLARVVLQHTQDIRLRLATSSPFSSTRVRSSNTRLGVNSTSSNNSNNRFEARARALQSILSNIEGAAVHVRLEDPLVPLLWAAIPKQRVTHLCLFEMAVTADILRNQLQLQQCTNLQALELLVCFTRVSEGDIAALSQDRSAWLPPSLTHLSLTPDTDPDVRPIARLLGPQITHLESLPMRDEHSADVHGATPYFTSLTHFSTGVLGSDMVQELLALPHLTHVSASSCHVYEDLSSKQCRWQVLEFRDGADIFSLTKLPLLSIQQVIVGHDLQYDPWGLEADGEEESVRDKLARMSNIQLQPCTRAGRPCGLPGFSLRGDHLAALLLFCAQCLAAPSPILTSLTHPHANSTPTTTSTLTPTPTPTPSTSGVVIVLNQFEGQLQELATSVQHLPPSVTTLCFSTQRSRLWMIPEEDVSTAFNLEHWPTVIAALPTHVKQVAVKCSESQKVAAAHAKAMLQCLSNSQQHVNTSIAVVLWDKEEPEEEIQVLVETYPQFKVIREQDWCGELRRKQELRLERQRRAHALVQ